MITQVKDMERTEKCHDCGVSIGEQHEDGCDVDRCSDCEGQRLSCECDSEPGVWSGIMMEKYMLLCEELGLYSKFTSKGWKKCLPSEEGASHDLNTAAIILMQRAANR